MFQADYTRIRLKFEELSTMDQPHNSENITAPVTLSYECIGVFLPCFWHLSTRLFIRSTW